MLFAAAQHFHELKNQVKTERQEKSLRHRLREEILDYGALKNAWGLGHIRVIPPRHDCKHCLKKHYVITGHYRDPYELTEKSVYLGTSYAIAHSRLNHVKSYSVNKTFRNT